MTFDYSKASRRDALASLEKGCNDITLPQGGENLGGLAEQIEAAVRGMDLTHGRGPGR